MMDRRWLTDKLLETVQLLSAHEERLKSQGDRIGDLEQEREQRSSFFRNGLPLWLAVFVSLAALLVSLFKN